MADRPRDPEAERREALDTLEQLRRDKHDIASSALTQAARRAADHFAAKDATPENDAIELWGRRIGRGLSLVAFVALAIYLYLTYVKR